MLRLCLWLPLALIGWVGYARLVRGQVLRAREFEYVQAARALVFEGTAQPNGYTEPLLHAWRLKVKSR